MSQKVKLFISQKFSLINKFVTSYEFYNTRHVTATVKKQLRLKPYVKHKKIRFDTAKYLLNMWKLTLIELINCKISDQQEPSTKQKYFFEFGMIMLRNAEFCLLFIPFFLS